MERHRLFSNHLLPTTYYLLVSLVLLVLVSCNTEEHDVLPNDDLPPAALTRAEVANIVVNYSNEELNALNFDFYQVFEQHFSKEERIDLYLQRCKKLLPNDVYEFRKQYLTGSEEERALLYEQRRSELGNNAGLRSPTECDLPDLSCDASSFCSGFTAGDPTPKSNCASRRISGYDCLKRVAQYCDYVYEWDCTLQEWSNPSKYTFLWNLKTITRHFPKTTTIPIS